MSWWDDPRAPRRAAAPPASGHRWLLWIGLGMALLFAICFALGYIVMFIANHGGR